MAKDAYLVALVCIDAFFLLTVLSNVVYFRHATSKARVTRGPSVSVIVPARNEEAQIGRCVESLLAQDYADYEVIVVDDESGDATAAIVGALATSDPRLRLVSGVPLRDGWLGKTHALSQGVAVASGEILVLTDADTVHHPESISWAVTNLQDSRADMLSGYLSQSTDSLGEKIIVPTMYAMMLLVPLYLLPRTRTPRLAFAIGQFVALRREALDDVGGYDAIKDSIVDDMAMAIRVKKFGHRVVFLDANQAADCHLYGGYRDAFNGIKRSVYSAFGGRPSTVAAVSAIVLGVIVAPAVWMLASSVLLRPSNPLLALAVALFAAAWAVVVWDRGESFVSVVLYPLVFFNLLVILHASMVGTGFRDGVDWKGRLVRVPKDRSASRDTRMAER